MATAPAEQPLAVYIEFDGKYANAEIQRDLMNAVATTRAERAKFIARELEPWIETLLDLEKPA